MTINRNLDETSKGSGFVLFEDSSAARSVLKHKLAHQIDGRSVKVYATLTKQEIKEYSTRQEQGQIPYPCSPRIDMVNLAHRNSQAPVLKITSSHQSIPIKAARDFQTPSQAKSVRQTHSEWQSATTSRLFNGIGRKVRARENPGLLLTSGDAVTMTSLRCAEQTTSDQTFCGVGAYYMMPTNCLSRSAKHKDFKAHAEDCSNLVFRFSNYSVSDAKVQELPSSHSQ